MARGRLPDPFDKMTFDEAHRAIKRGQIAAIEKAVPGTMSANAANRFGWTLLMLAALEGNTKVGALLIERGADVSLLNNFGESALSLAAHNGHLTFVKLLRSGGASGDVRPHGHTLEDWLRIASGLPQAKIDAILEAV
jgi:ankyrin repeat protein